MTMHRWKSIILAMPVLLAAGMQAPAQQDPTRNITPVTDAMLRIPGLHFLPHWKRQRRLIQPAFHRTRIASYGEQMVAATARMLDTWRAGQTRNLHADMMVLTLDIVSQALFSAE